MDGKPTEGLHINIRQGLEPRRRRSERREEWSESGRAESPSKMASLPFLRTGFLAKTRRSLCKGLTRRPWRYMFCGNGKGVAEGLFLEIGAAAG